MEEAQMNKTNRKGKPSKRMNKPLHIAEIFSDPYFTKLSKAESKNGKRRLDKNS